MKAEEQLQEFEMNLPGIRTPAIESASCHARFPVS
jgi:hypothetical protein